MKIPDTPDPWIEMARDLAALSGEFQPAELLGHLVDEPDAFARTAAALARDCDVNAAKGMWLMRPARRRHQLGEMVTVGRIDRRIVERGLHDRDEATSDLLTVLTGKPPFEEAAIAAAVSSGDDGPWLQRIVTALERAGPHAPASEYLVPAKSALAMLGRTSRADAIQGRGFFGRVEERGRLARWLSGSQKRGREYGMLVEGPPGIGKSALLDEAVADLPTPPVLVRLDFDRAGLDATNRQGLTLEAARQIGEQLGQRGVGILAERLETIVSRSRSETAAASGTTPRELVGAIALALDPGDTLVFVLDTLEVLQGRGERQIDSLFAWFADLREMGLGDLRIIAAGRPPIALAGGQFAPPIELEGLSPPEVDLLLDHTGVRPGAREEIIRVGQGHPLKLRLAIEVEARHAGQLASARGSKEVTAASLYRILLSRIPEDRLRKLARPGLVVRRLNAGIVHGVIAPIVRLGRIDLPEAQRLLDILATHHWLMDRPDGSGFLKHRTDLRALLLPLLYADMPAMCARLDRAAAAYFEGRGEPEAEVDALYHRLQLLRLRSEPAPDVPYDLAARFSDDLIQELPLEAQDLVRNARGERSVSTRGDGGGRADEDRLVQDLVAVIEKRDWSEGDAILDHLDRRRFAPESLLGDAVRTLYWRSGRWSSARALLKARDLRRKDDRDLAKLHPQFALARIEMRAELFPRTIANLATAWRTDPQLANLVAASPDRIARQGALALLLGAAFAEGPGGGSRRGEFPVHSALAARWAGGRDRRALGLAMDLAAERSRSWIRFTREGGDVGDGRLLAALSPYPDAASAWLSRAGDARLIMERTEALRDGLLEIGGLIAPGEPIEKTRGPDPLYAIAQMGLVAEWAQAGAWFWRSADLRLIGVAAERWRRAAAADWSYDAAPPEGWDQSGLDETTVARTNALWADPDPVGAACLELGIWCRLRRAGADFPEHEAVRLAGQVCKRLTVPDRDRAEAGREGRDPSFWALTLQRRRIPSAFIPPVSVMLAQGWFPGRGD